MLARVPYVICASCAGLSYVPRSYLRRAENCPACDAPLDAHALPLPARPTRPALDPGPQTRVHDRERFGTA